MSFPVPVHSRLRPARGLQALLTALGVLLAGGSGSTAQAQAPALFVEGYTHRVSYAPGETLQLHVSSGAPTFQVTITRIGATNEVVWSTNGVPGRAHPVPENASSHGCQWPSALALPIPDTWRSGYYDVRLEVRDGGGRYTERNARSATGHCHFVLRSGRPGQTSRILLQLATHTYNAYNNWGGFSLYAYHGRGGNQGRRVSYDRPPNSNFPIWEQPFVEWAERQGYTLDFAANGDLESLPSLLSHYRLILSVGHDEYWSAPMRDHVEAFITHGGNVAFLSGNTVCWQVRAEDDGRALTCWKQNFQQDPVFTARQGYATLSSLWSHHLVGRPENQLTGVGFLWGGYHRSHDQLMDASGAFKVHRPDHWLFAGTDLRREAEFGGADTIVGYECDGCHLVWRDGLPFPTGTDGTPTNFVVLATAPARWHPDDAEWYERWEKGREGNAVMGTYSRGGTVVTVGTTDWAHGLRGRDPAVERITRNLLDRLGR